MSPWHTLRDRRVCADLWRCVRPRCSVSAILLIGLLPWIESASAKEYRLTVSIHEELRDSLTQEDIEGILKNASRLMKHSDEFWTNDCDVEFKLSGPVQTFSSAPAEINTADDLEKVHRVAAHVKVVRKINYCRGTRDERGVIGCSWRERPDIRQKTVIVTTWTAASHQLWVHEFGHTTCLPHRIDDELALMTPCTIRNFNWRINRDECRHFLAGPRLCRTPDPNITCAAQ